MSEYSLAKVQFFILIILISMKKAFILLILFFLTMRVSAQSSSLRGFFSKQSVLNYFYYAHPNSKEFNGAELYSLTDRRAVIKVSFDGFVGSTFVCTIYIDLDSYGNSLQISTDCHSPSSWGWSCFDQATSTLRSKCRNMSNSSRVINMMERYYGKSFSQFNGKQLMCTLLNIAWDNY